MLSRRCGASLKHESCTEQHHHERREGWLHEQRGRESKTSQRGIPSLAGIPQRDQKSTGDRQPRAPHIRPELDNRKAEDWNAEAYDRGGDRDAKWQFTE